MSIDTTKQLQIVYFPGNQKPNTANLTEKIEKQSVFDLKLQTFKGSTFLQESQPGQNGDLIARLKDDICQKNESDFEIGDPQIQFKDIRLIVTVNYNSVYRVIPLVEVKNQKGNQV